MDLNDDCWILIFSLLNLKDQISVALVCQRFYTLLSSSWQRKFLNFSLLRVFFDTDDQLNVLMKSICGSVESMNLGCLTFKKWDVIKLYSYPNLRNLSMMHPQPSSDEDVLEMTKVFPNLQAFYPNSPDISGRHVEKWRTLTDLGFYDCEKVKFIHFEKILKEVPLKSVGLGIFYEEDDNYTWTSDEAFKKFCDLESISLCSDELVWLSDLSLFSNLRRLELLEIANDDLVFKLVRNIAEYKSNDLVKLHVTVHFPLNRLFVKRFGNLRKISFLWRNNSGFTEVLKYAPNLREVVIKEGTDLNVEDIYIWLNSNHIELLSIEKCNCKFSEFKLNVKDIVQDRTNLLHFNFYGNRIDGNDVTLDIQGKSSLLKITYDNLNSNWCDSNWFRFQ